MTIKAGAVAMAEPAGAWVWEGDAGRRSKGEPVLPMAAREAAAAVAAYGSEGFHGGNGQPPTETASTAAVTAA